LSRYRLSRSRSLMLPAEKWRRLGQTAHGARRSAAVWCTPQVYYVGCKAMNENHISLPLLRLRGRMLQAKRRSEISGAKCQDECKDVLLFACSTWRHAMHAIQGQSAERQERVLTRLAGWRFSLHMPACSIWNSRKAHCMCNKALKLAPGHCVSLA
jgi:hypothetical protein